MFDLWWEAPGEKSENLPGGFKAGQTVWATRDVIVKHKVEVRLLDQGEVLGRSQKTVEDRILVAWGIRDGSGEVSTVKINVKPTEITSVMKLPGGFQVGQIVWASAEIRVRGEVVVASRAEGLVMGPSSSTDRDRVLVAWRKQAGVKTEHQKLNIKPDQILATQELKLPGGLMVGQQVWAAIDITSNGAVVAEMLDRGTVVGPSMSTTPPYRVVVSWHDRRVHVLPKEIVSEVRLPGGFKVYQTVWACEDITVMSKVVVRKFDRGILLGLTPLPDMVHVQWHRRATKQPDNSGTVTTLGRFISDIGGGGMFDWLSQGETQDVESGNEEEHFTMNVKVGSITLNPQLEGVPVTLEKDVLQDDIKDDWNALEDIDVFACDGLEQNQPITSGDEPDTDDVDTL